MAKSPKKPAPAKIRPPKTIDELTKFEQRIVRLLNRKQTDFERAERLRLAIEERQKAATKRYEQRILALAKAASAYAQAHREDLLKGDSKTYTLPSGTVLEWYLTPHSVDTSVEDEVLIKTLESRGLDQYVRTPPPPEKVLDRQALLKAREELVALGIPGLGFSQAEIFATRFPPRAERIVHNLKTNRLKLDATSEAELQETAKAPATKAA